MPKTMAPVLPPASLGLPDTHLAAGPKACPPGWLIAPIHGDDVGMVQGLGFTT